MATRVRKDLNLFKEKSNQYEKKLKILDQQKKNHIQEKYSHKITPNKDVNEFYFDDEDDSISSQQIQIKKKESKEKISSFQNLICRINI